MLEFDRAQNWHRWWRFWEMRRLRGRAGTWSCREYFLAEDSLQYTLGFGTTNRDGMFELYDRMAKSFEFSAE